MKTDFENENKPSTEPATSRFDGEFAQVFAKTLNKSLDDIDDVTVARLKKSRYQALSHSSYFSRKWIPVSIAASLAFLAVLPILWHQHSVQNAVNNEFDMISQEVPPAAQELDDIEMLIAMDDIDV
jgi:hypothetical protein